MDSISHTFNRITEAPALKALFAILIGLFAVDHSLIVGVFVLMSIDTISGMWAAKQRGEKITSHKMRALVPKGIAYALFLMAFTVLSNVLGQPWIATYSFAWIALTETKSIAENSVGLDVAQRIMNIVTSKLFNGDLGKKEEEPTPSEASDQSE